MRYVPTLCLREGMKMGKNLYGTNGQILIAAKTSMKETYIDKIKELGYSGVYVDDDISEDIEIKSIIDDDLRMKTVKGIKDLFIQSESSSSISPTKIENVKKMVENIVEDILENKNLMVNMIDLKVFDDYTFYHSVNVAVISIVIGVAIGFNKFELYNLGLGALLHDIGKVFIEKEILNKNGKLDDFEYKRMKEHSYLGYEYLKDHWDIPAASYVGVLQHHERYDGSGYPNGDQGDKINYLGRIIMVADVYDALTSDRPYRKGMLPSEAIEYIMAGGGSLYDPAIVRAFIRKIAPYPVGTSVKLSNGLMGIVVENYESFAMRPKIKILKDEMDKDIEPYYIDLKSLNEYRNVTIVELANTI